MMKKMLPFFAALLVSISLPAESEKKEASSKASIFEGIKEKGTYAAIETSLGNIVVKLDEKKTPKTVSNFVGLAEGTKEFTNIKTGAKEKRPFYDGLIFHRVIPDFMIQGGCPRGNGTGDPGYRFDDECYEEGEVIEVVNNEEEASLLFRQVLIPYMRGNRSPDPEILQLVGECAKKQNGKPLFGKNVKYFLNKTGREKPLRKKGKLLASVDFGTICMANSGPNTNGSQFFIVTKKGGCPWLNGKHTVFGKVVKGMDVAEKIEKVERGAQDKPKTDVVINHIEIKKID